MIKSLTVLKNTVNIGLEKPVKLLHITDTHICMDEEGLPSKRSSCFDVDFEDCSKVYLEMALQYAKLWSYPKKLKFFPKTQNKKGEGAFFLFRQENHRAGSYQAETLSSCASASFL